MAALTPAQLHAERLAHRREQLRAERTGCLPALLLRDWLSYFRDGHDGCSPTGRRFDEVWPEALARACARQSAWWREMLEGQRDVWRRAYERGPQTSAEQWLAERADVLRLASVADDDEPPERACGHCGGSMDGRATQARYCRMECERDAARERQRTARKAQQGTPLDRGTLKGSCESFRGAVAA